MFGNTASFLCFVESSTHKFREMFGNTASFLCFVESSTHKFREMFGNTASFLCFVESSTHKFREMLLASGKSIENEKVWCQTYMRMRAN